MFKSLFKSIKNFFKKLFDAIARLIESIIDVVKDVLSGIASALARAGGWIVVIIVLIIIAYFVPVLQPYVVGAINSILTSWGLITVSLTAGEVLALLSVLALVTAVVSYGLSPSDFVAGVNDIFDAVSEPIAKVINGTIDFLADVSGSVVDGIFTSFPVLKYGLFALGGYFIYKLVDDDEQVSTQ